MKKRIMCLICTAAMLLPQQVFAMSAGERLDDMEERLPALKELLEECKSAGFDVGYDEIDVETIDRFIGFGREDIAMGDIDRAEYVADVLEDLYYGAVMRLQDYLDGKKSPVPVYRNKSSDEIRIEGGNIVNQNGDAVFFNGYGHGPRVRDEISQMQKFGADIIQLEIGPWSVMAGKGSMDGWARYDGGVVDASVEIAEGGRGDGQYVLKIENNTPVGQKGNTTVSQYISVKPETTYNLKFWARTLASGRAYYFLGGWDTPQYEIERGTNGWTEYSASYKTKPGQYQLELLFGADENAKAIYIDDVVVTEEGKSENIAQNGDFERPAGVQSEHFQANLSNIYDAIKRPLDEAWENDVRMTLLISPHYFIKESWENVYPEMCAVDSGLGYDMYNEYTREFFDLYIKTVMGVVGDCPALESICVANEPTGDTRKVEGLDQMYSEYLADKYENNIEKLNSVYGAGYQSFEEVKMPQSDALGVQYYDWVCFNDEYYGNWYGFLSETVKKYTDLPVNTKIMSMFGNTNSLNWGIDPEMFAEFSDQHGNDCYGFFNGSNGDGTMSKLMWYDFLRSVKDIPINNSEDHVTVDGDENYDRRKAKQIAADIWQGAAHGRDVSTLWVWERTTDKSSVIFGNILFRPDAVSMAGKTSLDLNRLSNQVAALQSSEPKVSILYSKTGRAYSDSVMNYIPTVYRASVFAGASPRFITEKQLESGEMPEGVLIVPGIKNITAEARRTIEEFEAKGGKIIAVDSDCLTRDEHDILFENAIEFDKVISPVVEACVWDAIHEAAGDNLSRLYGPDGKIVNDVDIRSAEYEGAKLLNLCNYNWNETKTVKLEGRARDLISGAEYESEITLSPFVPVLLELAGPAEMECRAELDGSRLSVSLENMTGFSEKVKLKISIIDKESGEEVKEIRNEKKIDGYKSTEMKYYWTYPKSCIVKINAELRDGEQSIEEISAETGDNSES